MTPEPQLDAIAKRIRLYLTTTFLLTAAVSGAAGWVIKKSNAELQERAEAHMKQQESAMARLEERDLARAAADSIWRVQVVDIMELSVIAIVEQDGSPEQRKAIEELKHRRHVTPVP